MLQVHRLQHRHRQVASGGEGGGLPAPERLDGVEAGWRQLHVLEPAALGQEHGGGVGPRVEVHGARVGPGRFRGGGHGEDLLGLVLAEHADLGLRGQGGVAGQRAGARDSRRRGPPQRVAHFSHRRVRHHRTRFPLAPDRDTLAGHEAVGAISQAVLPGEGGEDLRGRFGQGYVLEQVECPQDHARPFRVGHGGGPGVAVEGKQGKAREDRSRRRQEPRA